jgi:hypothetical protein
MVITQVVAVVLVGMVQVAMEVLAEVAKDLVLAQQQFQVQQIQVQVAVEQIIMRHQDLVVQVL